MGDRVGRNSEAYCAVDRDAAHYGLRAEGDGGGVSDGEIFVCIVCGGAGDRPRSPRGRSRIGAERAAAAPAHRDPSRSALSPRMRRRPVPGVEQIRGPYRADALHALLVGEGMSREPAPWAGASARYALSDEQVEEVKRRQQALREGTSRFATDEEINALWKHCGLEEKS